MLDALFYNIWNGGFEMGDGKSIDWSEHPLNAQASIAVFCETSGLTWRGKLHPLVEKAIDDVRVQEACKEIVAAQSVRGVFKPTLRLMEAMQDYGFFRVQEDEEDPDGEDGDGDGESSDGKSGAGGTLDVAGKPRESSSGSGDGGGESSDEPTDDDDEADASDGGGGGGGEGDDTESDDSDSESGAGKSGEGEEDEGDGSDDGEDGAGNGDDDSEDENDGGEDGSGDSSSSESADWGDADNSESVLGAFSGHDTEHPNDFTPGPDPDKDSISEEEIQKALNQADHFDFPSSTMGGGLNINKYDESFDKLTGSRYDYDYSSPAKAWRQAGNYELRGEMFDVPENILAPALQRARILFTENRRGKHERNLRAGSRLDGRVLAPRVAVDDPRVFQKRSRPKKRDYFVTIGMDCSGSTSGARIELIKLTTMAWAELMSRLGVKFCVYGHSGTGNSVEIFEVKSPEEPWSDRCRTRLRNIGSYAANLDGHTLEFYRKTCQRRRETDKLIFYITDGAMPAENYREELALLLENIKMCQRLGITLVGIGVENTEPERYGLETIRLDRIEDIPNCVRELEKHLE
jgi:cobalamin biosynthesis protein CobT